MFCEPCQLAPVVAAPKAFVVKVEALRNLYNKWSAGGTAKDGTRQKFALKKILKKKVPFIKNGIFSIFFL